MGGVGSLLGDDLGHVTRGTASDSEATQLYSRFNDVILLSRSSRGRPESSRCTDHPGQFDTTGKSNRGRSSHELLRGSTGAAGQLVTSPSPD